jgi:hypothetical protein
MKRENFWMQKKKEYWSDLPLFFSVTTREEELPSAGQPKQVLPIQILSTIHS